MKRTMKSGRTFAVAVVLLLVAQFGMAQTTPLKADVEKRVDSILGKMTTEEKIEMIGGINDFYTRPIPRLGIPPLRMSDGPMGVHDYGLTTAYPAGIALAASWDVDLAERFGTAMGKDARARGVHFILAPGMNIYRAPMNGRNFEYFGEDPFLASRMAVSVIRGIQGQRVIATAKHFAGNNSEFARMTGRAPVPSLLERPRSGSAADGCQGTGEQGDRDCAEYRGGDG